MLALNSSDDKKAPGWPDIYTATLVHYCYSDSYSVDIKSIISKIPIKVRLKKKCCTSSFGLWCAEKIHRSDF